MCCTIRLRYCGFVRLLATRPRWPRDRKDELPLRLSGFCSGRGRPFVRAPPQILIKGDMSTETSAPQLRPRFTPEPHRWIRPFGARYLIAAAATKTRKTSVKVSTFQILAHHLADDGAPGAVLLLVALFIDAFELLVIVLDQRIERSSARVAGFINSSRCGLHTPDNSQGWRLSQNIRTLKLPAFP